MPDRAKWSPTRLRTEAIGAERSGRPAEAVELLEASLRRDPEDWKTLRLLASLLVRLDRRREAHEHYRRLAALYEKDQLHATAIAVWKIILAGDSESVSVHVKLGELYALGGFRADAREHYGKALAACRASGRTREAGLVEARIADLDEASNPGKGRHLQNAVSAPSPETRRTGASPEKLPDSPAEPDDVGAADVDDASFVEERLAQGRLFRRYGLTDLARAQFADVLARRPDHVEARSELCDLLLEAGRHEEAAEHPVSPGEEDVPSLDLDLEPLSPEDHLRIDLDDDWTSAGREIRSAVGVQVSRDDYETRYDLGIAYREMGLLDEAIAELQLASRGSSRLIEATSLLAACFLDKGLPKLAVQWLERGLKAPGLLPQQAQSLRYDLARAHEARGDSELALSIYVELYGEDAGFRDVAEKVQRCNS